MSGGGRGQRWACTVLRVFRDNADPDGIVSNQSVRDFSRRYKIHDGTFSDAIYSLVEDGQLELVERARGNIPSIYRLTGDEPESDCPIESVVRMVPNRRYDGCAGELPMIAVSVARVKFLEGAVHG